MKKLFLFLIPVLFLFSSCTTDTGNLITVFNKTHNSISFYLSDNPDTIYSLNPNKNMRYGLHEGFDVIPINISENIKTDIKKNQIIGNSAGTVYTFYDITDYKYTVINTFSTPIKFEYDNNSVILDPGVSYSYYSYYNEYKFYFIINEVFVLGDNKYLIIT